MALQVIEKNTRVRLKIVGTRVDATEIVRSPVTVLLGLEGMTLTGALQHTLPL